MGTLARPFRLNRKTGKSAHLTNNAANIRSLANNGFATTPLLESFLRLVPLCERIHDELLPL